MYLLHAVFLLTVETNRDTAVTHRYSQLLQFTTRPDIDGRHAGVFSR